jgi:hypothetical protein
MFDKMQQDIYEIDDIPKRLAAIKALMAIRKEEQEYRARNEELVEVERVEMVVADLCAKFSAHLARFPDIHSSTLAHLTSDIEVHAYLTTEIDKVMSELRDVIKKLSDEEQW